MTTKQLGTSPVTVPAGTGFGWPGLPAAASPAGLTQVPWELAIQAATLQSTLWMSCAALQARWLGESLGSLGELPNWMTWHNGAGQLA